MTQIFTPQGTSVPVTVLEAELVQRRAAQDRPGRRLRGRAARLRRQDPQAHTQADARAFQARRPTAADARSQELRDAGDVAVGTRLTVEMFSAGQRIDVTGVSQGKGFSGQHKRHNFHRGPVSHGSHNIKQAGSIGSTDAARVFKGLKMAGRSRCLAGDRAQPRSRPCRRRAQPAARARVGPRPQERRGHGPRLRPLRDSRRR